MRFSKLFGRTLREVPAEAELVSHQLALRAGLIRPLAAGIYSYMPLGWRVLRKIEAIMRAEMDAIGGQDMHMPVVNPAEIWRATGRYDAPAPGPALVRFRDRAEHDLVLAMTHEEVVADLLRREVKSYRQLPFMVYHIQTKFRDEPRPRGGLIRAREFTMKDAYSCHADFASLDEFYPLMYQAYVNIFRRCGVRTVTVAADTGVMGGTVSDEFMLLSPVGEDTLVTCPGCGYAANAEKAVLAKGAGDVREQAPLAEVATPGCKTIEEVAAFLGVPTRQTLKVVFFTTGSDEVVLALLRGDLEVNLVKLSNALGGAELRPATEEDLRAAGLVAGYASPVGLSGQRVIADDSVTAGRNWVAGANKEGYHLVNVNYPRDFAVSAVTDIALARAGDACAHCQGRLETTHGIEVGHLFKLGTKYSEALGAIFLDQDGQTRPVVMASYGIGTGRLLAAIIEENHDERGIVWPAAVAPYQVHLLSLGASQPAVAVAAEELYGKLLGAGYEVLYDDREESAGVKFNDADLVGIPWRITVSAKTVARDSVEIKGRREASARLVAGGELLSVLAELREVGR
ncbi:MAG: proline--tRNA ligase [Chloroflexi bacterium]|nr:proline--tRNA ligase [Chloroflexota bacterium]